MIYNIYTIWANILTGIYLEFVSSAERKVALQGKITKVN